MTDKELMKRALEALTRIWEDGLENYPETSHERVMDALRERLSWQEQPVSNADELPAREKQERREWVNLNWEDLPDIHAGDSAFLAGARWAEAKLKEKNA